jgi:branched-chain amino acid aminotransferase
MAAIVNVNGRISSDRDAVVPVFDHGFLYGEGVYETLRTYGGRPFLLDRHLRRLRASAGMIHLPVPLTDEQFTQRIAETTGAARKELPSVSEWYLRILLTRGVGELTYDPAACPTPSLVLIAKPQVDPPPVVYEKGVCVVFASVIRNHPGSVNPVIKSNNLLNNALAMQEAIRKGAAEALMKNYRGEIAECSQSNVFMVKDGRVATPPLGAGLLAGITRAFMFDVAPAAGLPLEERTIQEAEIYEADEVFITGTTYEVTPVIAIDDHRIGTGAPGPAAARLLAAYRRMALASVAAGA